MPARRMRGGFRPRSRLRPLTLYRRRPASARTIIPFRFSRKGRGVAFSALTSRPLSLAQEFVYCGPFAEKKSSSGGRAGRRLRIRAGAASEPELFGAGWETRGLGETLFEAHGAQGMRPFLPQRVSPSSSNVCCDATLAALCEGKCARESRCAQVSFSPKAALKTERGGVSQRPPRCAPRLATMRGKWPEGAACSLQPGGK